MNLIQLRNFLYVAQTQSISQGAKKAYISQPAMTKQIKELEKELGTKLFRRLDRGVELTQAGHVFLSYIEPALTEIQKGIDAVSSHTSIRQKPIKLLVEVASSLIPEIIKRIHHIYPDAPVQLTQRISASNDLKKFDFIITSHKPDDNFNYVSLLKEKIYIGTAGNEFSNNEINASLLKKLPIVSLGANNPLRNTLDKAFAKKKIFLNYQYESDDPATIRELLMAHVGVGFIPAISWHNIGKELHLVKVKDIDLKRNIYLVEGKANEDRMTRLLANELVDLFVNNTQSN
ncbi:DNA-binding transcriptional LysR family regulator [Lactobacillus colini]|uniref:DNA-binding transcriptional LysR family regulator n=1 Tax=Lactobacillus colini TaxID=1819254 RepID=A0ABS4MDK2_9LACO|nr:LysR family transcriptional regulator [Lactobacillus colini]MBP2057760.1 DNA-binding transcriptional LysR family regulator [Lactobacillus colini]